MPLDIAVCGCGPGGLAAALFLHHAGHRVRLIERFETPKPVGSGLLLQPTGLAVLTCLGLGPGIIARGQRIARLLGRSEPSKRIALDVRYEALGNGIFGLAVHRSALFHVLHDAVAGAGIVIETGQNIAALERLTGERLSVVTTGGRSIGPFDLVVDALGSRSPLVAGAFGEGLHQPLPYGALWATLPWPGNSVFNAEALEQRYQRASVMVGVLPVGCPAPGQAPQTCFFWSLKSADYAAWRDRGLERWKDEVAAVWPATRVLLDAVHDPDQLALARYGHHTLRRPFAGRLAVIGDAAHATSPQLGQGANMALLDALALTTALERAMTIDAALATYARLRRRHVRRYQRMSALFTPFYQSDSRLLPALRDGLFTIASAMPGTPRLLASLVAGNWGRPLAELDATPATARIDLRA